MYSLPYCFCALAINRLVAIWRLAGSGRAALRAADLLGGKKYTFSGFIAHAWARLDAYTRPCASPALLVQRFTVSSLGSGADSMRALVPWWYIDVAPSDCRQRGRPAERTAQPLCLHRPQSYVVLPDGHAALVEVEQQTDAVALPRFLLALPVAVAGHAAPVVRPVEAVAVHIVRVRRPPSTSQPGRSTPNIIVLPCFTVNRAKCRPDRITALLAADMKV